MVMSVTGRGRGRRSALRAGARSPHVHSNPTKGLGSSLVGSWEVSNTGGGAADAFFELWFPVQAGVPVGVGFFGLPISVPPGGTATPSVGGIITLPDGVYAAEAHIKSWPSTLGGLDGILIGGNHPFTLTVITAEPILVPPLDLFFAPLANWLGASSTQRGIWLIEIAAFYGMPDTQEIDLRPETPWVIFSATSLVNIDPSKLGQTPQIAGLNA